MGRVSAIARCAGASAWRTGSQWSLVPNRPCRHSTGLPAPASIQRNSATALVSLTCPPFGPCHLGVDERRAIHGQARPERHPIGDELSGDDGDVTCSLLDGPS